MQAAVQAHGDTRQAAAIFAAAAPAAAPPASWRCVIGLLSALAGCGDGMEASQWSVVAVSPSTAAIVDGTRSAALDYPATGVILYKTEDDGQMVGAMLCSATLIAPDVLIAAGHCDGNLLGRPQGPVSYYFSLAPDVSNFGPGAQDIPADAVRIARFVPHPEFSLDNLGSGLRSAKDIALIFLESAIHSVPPARLIADEEISALVEDAEVFIVGYGRRHGATMALPDLGIKSQGTGRIREMGTHEMQVGRGPMGSYKCYGDSGGPTYMRMAGAQALGADPLALIGITSRVYAYGGCGTGGTDTRIDPFLPWIRRTLKEMCRNGTRPSCL
jgi:hypothetical protein